MISALFARESFLVFWGFLPSSFLPVNLFGVLGLFAVIPRRNSPVSKYPGLVSDPYVRLAIYRFCPGHISHSGPKTRGHGGHNMSFPAKSVAIWWPWATSSRHSPWPYLAMPGPPEHSIWPDWALINSNGQFGQIWPHKKHYHRPVLAGQMWPLRS